MIGFTSIFLLCEKRIFNFSKKESQCGTWVGLEFAMHTFSSQDLFLLLFMCICVEGGIGLMDAGRQIPERGTGSPGVRVTGGLESPNMSPGNRTWVL